LGGYAGGLERKQRLLEIERPKSAGQSGSITSSAMGGGLDPKFPRRRLFDALLC